MAHKTIRITVIAAFNNSNHRYRTKNNITEYDNSRFFDFSFLLLAKLRKQSLNSLSFFFYLFCVPKLICDFPILVEIFAHNNCGYDN